MSTIRVQKVCKSYRIRADIAAELEGLVVLLNKEVLPEDRITETFIMESAIAFYVKLFKQKLAAAAN